MKVPYIFKTPVKTIQLPDFPQDQAKSYFDRKVAAMQKQNDADALAEALVDPLKRRVDFEERVMTDARLTALSNSTDMLSSDPFVRDNGLFNAEGSGARAQDARTAFNDDLAELGSIAHRFQEYRRKKLVYAENAKHLPMAWAASTTVGRSPFGFNSNTTIVARNEDDFANTVLRKSDAQFSTTYVQRTYVVGTYAAVDVTYNGNEADKALFQAHLALFLGDTGHQLAKDYTRLLRSGQLLLRYAGIGIFLGLFVQIPALVVWGKNKPGAISDETVRNIFVASAGVGAAIALMGATYGALFFAARRVDTNHVKGVEKVLRTHAELMSAQERPGSAKVTRELQEASDYVGRHSKPVPQVDPDALSLVPISYVALDELEAYWQDLRPAPADG